MEQPTRSFSDPFDTYRRSRSDAWLAPHHHDRILDERLPPHGRTEQLYEWGPDGAPPVFVSSQQFQRARHDPQRDPIPWFRQQCPHPGDTSGSSWAPWADFGYQKYDDSDQGAALEGYEPGYAETISGSDSGEEASGKENEARQTSGEEGAEDRLGSKHEESLKCTCSNTSRHWALDERESQLNALESHLASRARDLEIDRESLEREREEFETRVRNFNEEQLRRAADLADSATHRLSLPHPGLPWFGSRNGYKWSSDWGTEQITGVDSFDLDDPDEYGGGFDAQYRNMRRHRYPYGY